MSELELFAEALTEPEPEFAVLYLHGPGGVGKSALLRMFADRAAEEGRPVIRIDGHEVRPNAAELLAALQPAPSASAVVLVDTFELLAPLDTWFREELVPGLPVAASSWWQAVSPRQRAGAPIPPGVTCSV